MSIAVGSAGHAIKLVLLQARDTEWGQARGRFTADSNGMPVRRVNSS